MWLTARAERRGIEPVPPLERRGRARGLVGVWFAANVGILSVVFGGIMASFGLDLAQGVAAAAVACLASFFLVALVSVAGTWSGMPSLTLSRRSFGTVGNLAPALVSWVSILGWEVVASVVAAWALVALARELFGVVPGRGAALGGLAVAIAASSVLGVLGHRTILRFQRWAALLFGGLSLVAAPILLAHAHWVAAAGKGPAPIGSVLAAGSIVAAGTGISWVNLAPDYSRYLPLSERPRAIVWWVTIAASFPTLVLVIVGYLLSSRIGGLSSSLDPIGPVGTVLPPWLAVPYLVVAAGGMLAEADLACYSSGLNLLALGVRVRRSRTILVDATVVAAGGAFLLLGEQGFLGPFESFLELLADGLAAWAGVVLADLVRARKAARAAGDPYVGLDLHYRSRQAIGWTGLAAWATGTAGGLSTTVSPWFTGPLARGFLARGSYNFVVALTSALLVCAAGWHLSRPAQPAAADHFDGHDGPQPTLSATAVGSALSARTAPRRLVVAGSILVDILLYVDTLPESGSDTLAHASLITTGGGFNVLTAARRLGLRAAYAGRVGDGTFGRRVALDLESAGITALIPPVAGEDSGFDVGVVEASGQRSFLTAPGTESRLATADLARVRLGPGDAVYVSGYDLSYPVAGPALATFLTALPGRHLLVVDPGPVAAADPSSMLHTVLRRVDILSANAREAKLMTGCSSPRAAAGQLAARLAKGGLAVVRAGAKGCWLSNLDVTVHVPGRPVEAVDTTGAGDVHVGAMLARLAAGDTVYRAAALANVAASISVGRPGGPSGPTAAELAAALGLPAGPPTTPPQQQHAHARDTTR